MLESAPAMDDWSGNSTLSSSDCQTLLCPTWLLLSSRFFITAIEMSSNWISIVPPTSTVAASPFEMSFVMFKMLVAIFTSSSFFFISAASIFSMSSLEFGSTWTSSLFSALSFAFLNVSIFRLEETDLKKVSTLALVASLTIWCDAS